MEKPTSAASTDALEPGAPVPVDAVDPELIRLSVPLPRRHPGVAIAVLIVGVLLVYRLRADLRYALQSTAPRDLGNVTGLVDNGQLTGANEQFVALSGIPDQRNALAFEPKGGRARMQVFRLLGVSSHLFVARAAAQAPPYQNRWSGRMRRFDDLAFADTLRAGWKQTQVVRALDLTKLKALPPGSLPSPLSISDRAGEPLQVTGQQDLMIDVLFENDLRVLLSKEKFPSEEDARHEVERLGLAHGPGVETRDGYGYVLRLPPKNTNSPERQRLLAQIDAQGIWLWHRVETYRVPAGAVQVTPAGLLLPGPDALPQPIRYQEQAPPLLAAQKDPNTLLLWDSVQAVQLSEPLIVPADAMILVDHEEPRSLFFTLPIAALLGLFMAFNIWYLLRSLSKPAESPTA